MGWGSPAVTRRRIQPDNTLTFAAGNVTESLQHVGFIRWLTLYYNSTFAYTKSVGGSTQDAMGPYNALTNVNIKVNGIGTFLDAPGWMMYLYNLVHFAGTNFDPASTENSNILQQTATSGWFSFPAVPGSSGNISPSFSITFPFTVEIAGIKEVGLFILQNDEVNVQLTPTFNGISASATKLAAPYDIAGGDTFTLGTPTLQVTREFYAVPASEKDYPVVGWFHQIETAVQAANSSVVEIAHPKGGIILRAIYQAVDGSTPALAPSADIQRLQWLYGSNETPYDESLADVLLRQVRDYGHALPQGAMVHDFFGHGQKTLRDCFDTQQYQNLRTHILWNGTPNAGSYVICTRERLIPIGNTAEALY